MGKRLVHWKVVLAGSCMETLDRREDGPVVPERVKLGTSLGAKDNTKARSYREQTGCFGKVKGAGKTEGSRKRGRPPMTRADSMGEAAGRVPGS